MFDREKDLNVLILFLGFLFGVGLNSFFRIPIRYCFYYVPIFLAGCILFYCGKDVAVRLTRSVIILILFITAFVFGGLRFSLADTNNSHDELKTFTGTTIEGEGIVVAEPDERENSLRLTVDVVRLKGSQVKDFKEKMLIVADGTQNFSYGDLISFKGVLEKPDNFQTDSGRTFKYVEYLAKDGIGYQMKSGGLELISKNHGNYVVSRLLRLKKNFIEHLKISIPSPESALLAGILVGAKQSLGTQLLKDFTTTGVIHVVVISGYNITIVVQAMSVVFGFLPVTWAIIIKAVAVIGFVLMTGASGASVRAGYMALLLLLAATMGRKYNVTRAVLFSAFCMVMWNPYVLIFDPSFQLSFMATLGLLFVPPYLSKYFMWISDRFFLKEIFISTLSVQLFLLPLLLYFSGLLSIVSLPVNMLVLFPIPILMLFGFITGLLGYVSWVAAFPVAFLTYGILHYILLVVETAAHLRWAAVSISYFPFWLMCLVYLFYTFILWRFHTRDVVIEREKSGVI